MKMFEVGDTVKVKATCEYQSLVGKTGVVTKLELEFSSTGRTVMVDFDGTHLHDWYMKPEELELVNGTRQNYEYQNLPAPIPALKDSGERQSFATGAVRDTATGKPRLELLPPWAMFAYGWIMEAGASKYAARNWEKGMPISRYLSSAKRHINLYMAGFRDEPHLWQALWNIGCAVHTQILVYIGVYPAEFYDLPNHIGKDPAPILSEFEKIRVDGMMEASKK